MSKMGYALVNGVGVMIIPSPRPNEVRDLVLEPFHWTHVDPLYQDSPVFRRYLDKGAFEFKESDTTPEDPDLTIKEDYDRELDPAQRQFVRHVTTLDLTDQMRDMISIATQVNDSGIPQRNSKVTVAYLRERHRPMLLAIEDLEQRHKKRRTVLSLVKKQLQRIAQLPS